MNKHTQKKIIKATEFHNPKNLNPKCAGIDIGADSLYVCALNSKGKPEVKEFPVFTQDLLSMCEWLKDKGVESVAMESTGIYWIPCFEMLEQNGFEPLLVNPYFFKCVPGRKTDVKDAQWIQQLHSHGLLSGSFRPIDEYVRLRAIVRQRANLFQEGARQIQHMHKSLTQMNVQLRIAVSDITGATGLAIIKAIIAGERDPLVLASYRDRRCKKNVNEIAKALNGNWREEHIFVLKQSYDAYEFYHRQINECEILIKQIIESLPQHEIVIENNKDYCPPKDFFADFRPKEEVSTFNKNGKKIYTRARKKKCSYDRSPYFFDTRAYLKRVCGVDITEVPGIGENIAMGIISEIGTDMSKWKNKKHFSSWLCLCPGNKVSGGKVLSSKTRPSDNKAAQALRLAANAVHNSANYIGAYYRRMRSKFGPAKAITATAHKLAVILYTMLRDKKSYKELGGDYFEKKYKERKLKSLEKQAKELGYELKVKAA